MFELSHDLCLFPSLDDATHLRHHLNPGVQVLHDTGTNGTRINDFYIDYKGSY